MNQHLPRLFSSTMLHRYIFSSVYSFESLRSIYSLTIDDTSGGVVDGNEGQMQ
jgi:hypothetical protein